MNKNIKMIILCLSITIFISLLFLSLDYFRLSNNEKTIFSISFAQYLDGGTIEYYGLGYKIIDYNILNGYKGIKVGTWFLKYNNCIQ